METDTVFKYADLSDTAKAKAREWFTRTEHELWEPSYDDVCQVLGWLGFDLDTREIKLMNNRTRQEPLIHYSIAYSQGDGASFEGQWRADRMNVGEMLEDWPQDDPLKRISAQLMAVFLQYPEATCRVDTSAASSGIRINDVELGTSEEDDDIIDVEGRLKSAVGDIGDWIYQQFRDDLDYRLSDENAVEGIEANDYDFDEDGDVI